MKKIRRLCLLMALILTAGAFIGGQRALAEGGPLVVGVRADVVNFGFLNETTGKYYGLEIDLANELARRLGRDGTQFVTVTPSTRESVLQSGQAECLIACYSIDEEREELFDFSAPYYSDGTVFMVQTSTCFKSWPDLGGKTVGILAGSNTGALVTKTMRAYIHTDVNLVEAETYPELSEALELGEVDAICTDGCIAQAYLNDDRVYLPGSLATQYYGVATPKGSELSGQIAAAMDEMLADGTVDAYIDKWD